MSAQFTETLFCLNPGCRFSRHCIQMLTIQIQVRGKIRKSPPVFYRIIQKASVGGAAGHWVFIRRSHSTHRQGWLRTIAEDLSSQV